MKGDITRKRRDEKHDGRRKGAEWGGEMIKRARETKRERTEVAQREGEGEHFKEDERSRAKKEGADEEIPGIAQLATAADQLWCCS